MQDDTTAPDLGFPSNKKISRPQAPIYAALLVGGIIMGSVATASLSPDSPVVPQSVATSTPQAAAPSTTTPTTTAQATPTAAPLMVSDQRAGPSVTIHQLNIARPTWVVVYVSREGKPGNALGARLFMASDKKGSVGLLRNTQAGQSYFVGLSVDNGDRTFSLTKDKPIADADGGPLWATFRAL